MHETSARLLALLSLLQARRDWPGGLLAERLDVSPRTVRRDVDRLRELGYPIRATKGPDGGYRLDAGTDLPPLLFDDEQAVALAVGLRIVATSGVGVEEAAARALGTVRQVMPARLRHRIDGLSVTAMGPSTTVDPAVLTAVGDAVRAREVLRFGYGNDAPPRRAEPHHLVTRGGRWYLVAWDLDRADWRTFRVDRIDPRVPTGPRFAPREVPGGDVAAFVAGRFRGNAGAGDWPCRGEAVVALPAAELVPYVRDELVEEVDAGHCRMVAGAWSWVALAARFGALGADLSAVAPAELRDACATLADRYARAAGTT
ncbi:helix-turn-helix transcriptional regulator [Actinomycetospora sp. C-140]